MTLEQQVCSLELAKKLKELGVKQESYFAHYKFNEQWELAVQCNRGFFRFRDMAIIPPSDGHIEFIAAFTVAELGEILKLYLPNIKDLPEEFSDAIDEGWDWIFSSDYWAKMLIYLLEHKIINL